jgi:hypothetical protein
MSERSELFEALAELTERSEKKNSDCASEVGGRSPSRSQQERIINLKWDVVPVRRKGGQKE